MWERNCEDSFKERPNAVDERKRTCTYDGFTLMAVRTCLRNFFCRGEIPTLKKVAAALRDNDMLPSCSESTVYRVPKDLGFEKRKRDHNSFLIEREYILEQRRHYLRAIGNNRAENCKTYCQDETWVNAGHTIDRVWTDTTVTSANQAFLAELSTGLKVPSEKKRNSDCHPRRNVFYHPSIVTYQ